MAKSSNSEKVRYQLDNHEDRITRIENKIDNIERAVVKVTAELEFLTKSIEELKNTIKNNGTRTVAWAAVVVPFGWGVLYFIFELILKLMKNG